MEVVFKTDFMNKGGMINSYSKTAINENNKIKKIQEK